MPKNPFKRKGESSNDASTRGRDTVAGSSHDVVRARLSEQQSTEENLELRLSPQEQAAWHKANNSYLQELNSYREQLEALQSKTQDALRIDQRLQLPILIRDGLVDMPQVDHKKSYTESIEIILVNMALSHSDHKDELCKYNNKEINAFLPIGTRMTKQQLSEKENLEGIQKQRLELVDNSWEKVINKWGKVFENLDGYPPDLEQFNPSHNYYWAKKQKDEYKYNSDEENIRMKRPQSPDRKGESGWD